MGRDLVHGEKVKLFMGVLALQFLLAGFHIVSRAALNMGISKLVFIVYRNIISLALLAPFAYFLEKCVHFFLLQGFIQLDRQQQFLNPGVCTFVFRKDRPPLTFSLLAEFFVLALIGITANQGFYLLGLYHLSPTYASAIQNMVPAITFVLAAVLRLEQVDLGRRHGVAKVVGTVVSVGGATVITLYKGLPLFAAHNLHVQAFLTWTSESPIFNWTLGCVFILGHCLSWSGWMVLQVPVLKRYPARLSVISLTCVFGLLQFLVIAAFTEEDLSRWKVRSGGELFTILYAVSISTVN
jgi:drug/metabolite transporter (DMT)-like permease